MLLLHSRNRLGTLCTSLQVSADPKNPAACISAVLARGGVYKATGDAMGRSESTVHRCVTSVTKILWQEMGSQLVGFPSEQEELQQMVRAVCVL